MKFIEGKTVEGKLVRIYATDGAWPHVIHGAAMELVDKPDDMIAWRNACLMGERCGKPKKTGYGWIATSWTADGRIGWGVMGDRSGNDLSEETLDLIFSKDVKVFLG